MRKELEQYGGGSSLRHGRGKYSGHSTGRGK